MKKVLLTAAAFLVACAAPSGGPSPSPSPSPGPAPSPSPGPSPAPSPSPSPTLTGVWSGRLSFSSTDYYNIWVDFDAGVSNVMVFQESAGYIGQRGANTLFTPSTRQVAVNWHDTIYSCAVDTFMGSINATLSTDGSSINGTFQIGPDASNSGSVTLTPASTLPSPIKTCPN